MLEQKEKNDQFIDEIREQIERLKMYVPTDKAGYDTIAGVQPDPPSLLS
jgi:archaellum component FlaC